MSTPNYPTVKATLNQTLTFRWFGGKKITIEAGTPIVVRLKPGRWVTEGQNFDTRFDPNTAWRGYHNGLAFELEHGQFTILE